VIAVIVALVLGGALGYGIGLARAVARFPSRRRAASTLTRIAAKSQRMPQRAS
jgi:hypothetical protein